MTNTNRERGEELEELGEPDKIFDCFDGCDSCTVCKYLNFLEWAEGCAPAESTIERNEFVEDYLKRKSQALKDAREEAYQAGLTQAKEQFAESALRLNYDTGYQAGLRRAREAIRNMQKVNRGTNQYEEKYVRWNSFGKDVGVDDLLTALSEEIKSNEK